MRKALAIYSHPSVGSFNHAILETAINELSASGVECKVKNLYRMDWNPVFSLKDYQMTIAGEAAVDVSLEQNDILWADLLIFIYPVWWGGPPAILKGWLDRVFTEGFAYNMVDGQAEGLLKGKKAVVITTSGDDKRAMKKNGVLDAIRAAMIERTLGYVGIKDAVHHNLYAVGMMRERERLNMLGEVRDIIRQIIGEKAGSPA